MRKKSSLTLNESKKNKRKRKFLSLFNRTHKRHPSKKNKSPRASSEVRSPISAKQTLISPLKRSSGTPKKAKHPFPIKKRPVTPITVTPKKLKVDFSNWVDIETDVTLLPDSSDADDINFCSSKDDEFQELLGRAFNILAIAGLKEQFLTFFELVAVNSFPLNNLSLLLFLETVKFYYCSNTSEMRYSDITKRFWKAGYRLFHGKFLYFMGGPKNIGTLAQNSRGTFNPKDAKINFAVPSVSSLESFKVSEIDLPTRMPTGVIEPVLKSLSSVSDANAYMLCADGKKVTAGIDKVGGDVDMFGFEDGEKIRERSQRLENELSTFSSLILDLKDGLEIDCLEKCPITVARLKQCNTIISKRLQEARELKKNQEFGLSRFKTLGGEKWKESKYVYAISGLQASLYEIKEYIRQALGVVKQVCRCISLLEGSVSSFHATDVRSVDITRQDNMLFLDTSANEEMVESRFVKQRSPLWFRIREKARVTGSTIHSALGLRGKKEQAKHIEKTVNKVDQQVSDEVSERMSYGTENEINALTTLASIVMPAYFPKSHYVEEGCYADSGDVRDVLLVVSPDGSIRDVEQTSGDLSVVGNAIAAIEVKCPFPKDNTVPVHYTLPEYYVCQCLAEMHVLRTDKLMYVCYSEESTTILEVCFDKNLWDTITSYISDIYDNESPKVTKQSKATSDIKSMLKEFVKTNVHLVVEVPSVTATEGGLWKASSSLPFKLAEAKPEQEYPHIYRDSVIKLLREGMQSTETCYNLRRRKATEVMVWVLTNINRNSTEDIPCSVPIAYGLKDYKLTSVAMRQATNHVLCKLREKGIRVCSFSTDGQWINLMVRDDIGRPLTLLQLQKDVWSKVQKISKPDLVKLIGELNKVKKEHCDIRSHISVCRNSTNAIIVESRCQAFQTVRTSADPRLWSTNKTKSKLDSAADDNDNGETDLDNTAENMQWMPEEVIQSLQTTEDEDLRNAVKGINAELFGTDENVDLGDLTYGVEENNDNNSTPSYQESMNIEHVIEGEKYSFTNQESVPVNAGTDDDSTEPRTVPKFTLNGTSEIVLASSLKETTEFKTWDFQKLHTTLTSKTEMVLLTHKQLNCLHESLKLVSSDVPVVCKSWKKEKKVSVIFGFVNNVASPIESSNKRRKMRSPESLSKLCIKTMQSRKLPKAVLNVAYASYIYPEEHTKWLEQASLNSDIAIKGHESDIQCWYSFPVMNSASQSLIGNSIDCSHNFTHLRVRCCTTGIGDASPAAWKAAAESNETHLNIALVEDLLDKQSVPNARTTFSEEVENWMIDNGYNEAANVISIIRNWYDASDAPGISANQRINDLIRMRNFLLKDVNFGKFPPPGRYINKIPTVTYEGILVDIDTKLQMYALTGAYNIRSVGSLAAETMVGVLQEMNPTTGVSIKARDVPSLISSVVEVMTCKINPDRGFFMRTSRVSGVYPVHESDRGDRSSQSGYMISPSLTIITPSDHAFDKAERQKTTRRIRFGTVSEPSAPSRGARPVREFHHRDESKILKEKRLKKKPALQF